jgi:hypothetical protein
VGVLLAVAVMVMVVRVATTVDVVGVVISGCGDER